SKASLVEQPFKPQLTAAAHEAMQDIDWKAVPPLGGYVATTLKQTAELVLMSHQEDPVLATWRYGLGRAAAFTSDATAKRGVPGRYRGRFAAEQEGVYLVGIGQRRQERVIGSQLAGLVVPYAQELRDLGVDEARLRELAELTGGGALGEPRETFQRARRQSRIAIDVWPWLVGLVA